MVRKVGRKPRATRDPDAAMTLIEHLRELRSRLFKSAIAITIGSVVGWIYYEQIFAIIRRPYDDLLAQARAQGKDVILAITGVTDAFSLQLKISIFAGLLLASPVWLFQLWRFLAPGLTRRERKWSYIFTIVATPLFMAGCALGYAVLPRSLELFFGFTPVNTTNIYSVDTYLSFILQFVIFFGLGFLIPLIFVMLNFAGILTGRRLASWWRGLVFGTFVFAAVATPSGDPIGMILLAVPMMIVVSLAIGISLINDARRRRRTARDGSQWADDETSPLDTPGPLAEPVDGSTEGSPT